MVNRIPYRGRFAPSPTGELHFGSLVAAVGSFLDAKANGGEWVLRIEDVDTSRCRSEYETSILKTLDAFGFEWDGPVLRQSERTGFYRDLFDSLRRKGFVYGCACTRKEIAAFVPGVDGAPVYPGTCRNGVPAGKQARAFRLRVPDRIVAFDDAVQGRQLQNLEKDVGDFVLLRADGLFAYQLAVVADDIAQGITHIVRGADLLASTPRQIWLYECLGERPPFYAHLPLAVNGAGEKLSKQTRAAPVDTSEPATPLRTAMRFLNLHPDKTTRSLHDLWNWAIMNWSIENVPRKQTMKSPIQPVRRTNMIVKDEKGIREILENNHVVAIVGYSANEEKGAHYVPKFLKEHGYQVVPVNPAVTEGLGEKAYASLKDIPFPVDIVDCFRRPDAMPGIAREAVEIGAKVLWMQKGIESEEAAKIASDAGLKVVSDRCMLEAYTELFLK